MKSRENSHKETKIEHWETPEQVDPHSMLINSLKLEIFQQTLE